METVSNVALASLDAVHEVRRSEALCQTENSQITSLFFSDKLDDIGVARAICRRCSVREQCLEDALERGEPFGVWGGELFRNGKIKTKVRQRGRPPKDQALKTDEWYDEQANELL